MIEWVMTDGSKRHHVESSSGVCWLRRRSRLSNTAAHDGEGAMGDGAVRRRHRQYGLVELRQFLLGLRAAQQHGEGLVAMVHVRILLGVVRCNNNELASVGVRPAVG